MDNSYLKGVGYQQNYEPNGATDSDTDYTDPLADATACARDIPYMKKIFTNVIRVYAIDPTADHDACMALLASNDIYVLADLSAPSLSINSNDPQWNLPLYERYTSVVDALQKYDNVIGFFAGNEVVNTVNQTGSAAFVKAAVRDTKNYIHNQGYRTSLGVGYATSDVPTRDALAHYFACELDGTGNSTSIDYWGYNVYSWCGESSYASSSYDTRVEFFSDYPVPVFFAEYGCIEGITGGATHRPFTEVEVLYSNMTEVFSGGIVYEWFMEENDYGLVTISGSSVSAYPDFTSLQSQLAKVTPTITMKSAYTPSNSAPACPTSDSTWLVVPTVLPPAVNSALCDCEMAALGCTITSTDSDLYGDVFDYICASSDTVCAGIAHNATLGTFGAISGCSAKQQLAWVANQYYLAHSSAATACDFSGLATTQAPSTASTCSSLISAAGTAGTGSVAAATGASSSSSSGAGAALSGFSPVSGFFDYGRLLFSAYVITAVVSAVGILVL